MGNRLADILDAGEGDGFLLAEPLLDSRCGEDIELPLGDIEDVGRRRVGGSEEAEDIAVGAAAGVVRVKRIGGRVPAILQRNIKLDFGGPFLVPALQIRRGLHLDAPSPVFEVLPVPFDPRRVHDPEGGPHQVFGKDGAGGVREDLGVRP